MYLCVFIPTPENWRTLALIYLWVCFKITWCLAEIIYFERYMLWEIYSGQLPQTCSDLTTGMNLCRWNLEMSESYFHFITMLRSPPKEGIHSLPGTVCAMCKGVWKTARVLVSLNTSLCAWHRVRPNRPKYCSLEQRKIYHRAMQGDEWLMPPKPLNSPKGFCKAFLKARWRRGFTGYVISSCTILWLVDSEVTVWCHRG